MIAAIQTRDQSITQTLQNFLPICSIPGPWMRCWCRPGFPDPPCQALPDRFSGSGKPYGPAGPGFFVNAGPVVSRLTRSKSGATIGVWLRPCEVRAFVELTKLRQGAREEVVILSMDCPMGPVP